MFRFGGTKGKTFMPATFAHCLIAREAIERIGKTALYSGILRMNNNFVIMGATGPDYPYLTDVIKYGILHIGHNWANRMHYENTTDFVEQGIKNLSAMDKKSGQFQRCLAWFAGYVSHVIADSFVHPVINCIVGGVYIFTHVEHGYCELIQDVYIFKQKTGTDIIKAASRDNATFGYLDILDDCSDPDNLDNVHPDIEAFWMDLLKTAHPNAFAYFADIKPSLWHKNYKNRIDFISDSRCIFRHVLDIVNAPRYIEESAILQADRDKYLNSLLAPDGAKVSYDVVFSRVVDLTVAKWKAIFARINGTGTLSSPIKDWNLDTGVDESKIDLWITA